MIPSLSKAFCGHKATPYHDSLSSEHEMPTGYQNGKFRGQDRMALVFKGRRGRQPADDEIWRQSHQAGKA